METINEKLLDRYIRHAVYIERFKAGEAKKISRHLSKEVFPELIDKLMTKIKTTDPSKLKKLWVIRRLRRLTASTDKIIKVGMIKAKEATIDSLMNLAEWEAKWNKGLIEKIVPLDIDMTMPNPEVLRQAVLTTPFEGHKLGTWFNAYSKSVRIGMMGAVKKGISAGEDLPSIGRRLRKVASLKRKQAEYIARTAVSSVTNSASEAVYLLNKDLVKEIQYVSTLDTRTTLICINLDGQIFVVGRGPRPPMHFNCRSRTVPVISSWKEFGIKDPPPATRASMTGKVPAKMTYKTWLRRQSKATQIKVLGKRRAELYRSGQVKIEKFVGKDYKPLTLKQIAKREGIALPAPPPLPGVVVTKVGTTFTGTATKEFNNLVEKTINTYPEKVKLALKNQGISYRVGNSLTEMHPGLKGLHPRGWSKGATWDSVEGMYNIKTKSISIAETYRPIGQKFSVLTPKSKIRAILNHETGHGFDASPEGLFYSNRSKFKAAYAKDIAKLSKVDIAKNNLRFFLQKGVNGRSELFADVFADSMGGGARLGVRKFFPNSAKYIDDVLKAKVVPIAKVKPIIPKITVAPAPPRVSKKAIAKVESQVVAKDYTKIPTRTKAGWVDNWTKYYAKHEGTKPDKMIRYDWLKELPKSKLSEKQIKFITKRDLFWKDGVHRSAMPTRDFVAWIEKLTRDELNSIKNWKMGSYNIRKFQLAQATKVEFEKMAAFQYTDVKWTSKNLANAFSRAPNYTGTTYRGTGLFDEIKNMKVGKTLEWNANYSTSKNKKIAEMFMGEAADRGVEELVLFEIKNKTAVDLASPMIWGKFAEQKEVVTRIGIKFKITKIEKIKEGVQTYTKVILEEI